MLDQSYVRFSSAGVRPKTGQWVMVMDLRLGGVSPQEFLRDPTVYVGSYDPLGRPSNPFTSLTYWICSETKTPIFLRFLANKPRQHELCISLVL